jgi:UDP-2,4-diacetamido-2,4,6-trideoxy-beta-L-altropyranose hydrolase
MPTGGDRQFPPLLIRADGGAGIGMGHVMRTLALAEAWRARGAAVTFRGQGLGETSTARLTAAGVRTMPARPTGENDARETVGAADAMAREHDAATWVLLDGYHFGEEYPRAIRRAGHRLMLMDDLADRPLCADVLLNQNHGAEELDYETNPDAVLLLGSSYALLRREFLTQRASQRQPPERARRLLLTFGGADTADMTRRVLRALGRERLVGLEVTALIGPASPRREPLQQLAREHSAGISLYQDPRDLPHLMASADLAITAGGSTCWELALLGVPMLVIPVAENQVGVAASLERAGAAENLGWHADLDDAVLVRRVGALLDDASRRAALGAAGRRMIDGAGCDRVLEVVAALAAPTLRDAPLMLRPARSEDTRQIWRLANDPTLRAGSFDRPVIPFGDHVGWFSAKLADPDVLYLLLDVGGVVAAQIRFERAGDAAELHFSVAPAFRGKGLGTRLLVRGAELVRDRLAVKRVHGVVRQSNPASVRAFRGAGYTQDGEVEQRGYPCYLFEKEVA